MNQILRDNGQDPNKRIFNYNNNYRTNLDNGYTSKYNDRYHNNYYYNNNNIQQNYNNNSNSYYNNKANINSVVRVFAIVLILFGVILIGQSVYGLTSSENRPKDNPEVSMDRMGREVSIKITTEQPIKEFSYKWNEGEPTVVRGNGTNTLMQTLDVPNGNNILNITVIDFYGNKTQYQQQFLYQSNDTQKPKIDFAVVGTKLSITASDENQLRYITYKWNDEEEKRVDAEEGQKEITQELEVRQGQNEFTITAVDSEDNKITINRQIIGDTKPELSISTEGNNIVITAKDDEGISKLIANIDGQTTDSGEEPLNRKEVTAKVPVTNGTHTISATAINVNGLEITKTITANI